MLLSLHIENIAVVKTADIDFSQGFMVLSGETGAGKSIIIDSIELLLGAKADRELIRNGEASAMVSGLFGSLSQDMLKKFSDCGVEADENGEILIQRMLSTDGRSQVKINGRSVTLSVLKLVSQGLIAIHGQSDTGALLDPDRHLEMVDIYADTAELLNEYRVWYSELEKIRQQIDEITEKEQQRERLKEILAYQIKDIDDLQLHEGEEEELVDKKIKIKNSAKIVKNSEFVYKALKGSEKGGVTYLLDRSITALTQLSGVVGQFDEYSERLRDMLYSIDDIAEEVHNVLEEMDCDADTDLNDIEARLDKISRIKRKYGLTVADVLRFRDNAKEELDRLENSEEMLLQLKKKEEEVYCCALDIADRIHSLRVEKVKILEEKVKQTLEFLDMPKVVFYASVKDEYKDGKKVLRRDGADLLEFYISANRGADAQSISKIASGGELARIMLALKSVIADKDGTMSLVFDEIDAGVSGKTARKIGLKMRSLSEFTQVFCVTHSAQIASLADKHYLISKSDIDGMTQTSVTLLDYEGRVNELSRILGGINVTSSQRAAAIDMLGGKDN